MQTYLEIVTALFYLFGDDVIPKSSLCYNVKSNKWSIKKMSDGSVSKFY